MVLQVHFLEDFQRVLNHLALVMCVCVCVCVCACVCAFDGQLMQAHAVIMTLGCPIVWEIKESGSDAAETNLLKQKCVTRVRKAVSFLFSVLPLAVLPVFSSVIT